MVTDLGGRRQERSCASPSPPTTGADGASDDAMVGAMTRSGRRLPHWLSVVLLAAVLALVTLPAAAQAPAPFRVTHAIDKGTQPPVNHSRRGFHARRRAAG